MRSCSHGFGFFACALGTRSRSSASLPPSSATTSRRFRTGCGGKGATDGSLKARRKCQNLRLCRVGEARNKQDGGAEEEPPTRPCLGIFLLLPRESRESMVYRLHAVPRLRFSLGQLGRFSLKPLRRHRTEVVQPLRARLVNSRRCGLLVPRRDDYACLAHVSSCK